MKKLKILVTGGGKFAFNWTRYSNYKYENIIVSKSDRHLFHENTFISMNLNHSNEVLGLIRDIKPDVIINSAAITNVNFCQEFPTECNKINTKLALNLFDIANSNKIKFIQISTDHFESHYLELRNELVRPVPINQYGFSKIRVDEVMKNNPSSLIIRTNFFGFAPDVLQNSFQDLHNRLTSGLPYPGITDIFYTPISLPILIEAISKLIGLDYNGIINISGNNNVSKFTFAQVLAKELKLKTPIIDKLDYESLGFSVPRPKNMGLDNSKLLSILPDFPGDLTENIDLVLKHFENIPKIGKSSVW